MPQSLAQLLVHVVFSTKHREPLLKDGIRRELHAYIGGIVANLDGTLLDAGSVTDHIHLLVAHPRTCAPAELFQDEYRNLLRKYGIEWDERYVWD